MGSFRKSLPRPPPPPPDRRVMIPIREPPEPEELEETEEAGYEEEEEAIPPEYREASKLDEDLQPQIPPEELEEATIAQSLALATKYGVLPRPPIKIKDWMTEAGIDLTMMANISMRELMAIAYGIALETEYPCKARKWFMEMILRGSRSVRGGILQTVKDILQYALSIPQGGEGESSRAARAWNKFMSLLGRRG